MKLDSLPPSLSASDSAAPNSDLPPQVQLQIKDAYKSSAALTPESAELSVNANTDICQEEKKPKPKHWAIFASTFGTIFFAEIGDKTQLAILLMTAESRNPWIVFAGAGSALIATSLLGVLLGRWLASRIAPRTLEKAAGVILLAIAAVLLWEVLG
ncbi:TMEM165/GDT1 family protein [Tychonema sp. LEGE 07203]|uniref:TMEM165/GDT1 family protein n=1 Tax=Tychonema sp. LEGE 07203 TaxID=1828671 RepID=UPI0018820015|nr:TMEM165/GDT1 family protein [Tychonema sp. LEGE 07203]